MEPITDAELDELERNEKAATPAPWSGRGKTGLNRLTASCGGPVGQDAVQMNANHDLAIEARNVFPRLLAEHRKLRGHIVDTVGEDGLADLLKDEAP